MIKKKLQDVSRRLTVRALLLVLVSVTTFALVLALLLSFGLGKIMQVWHDDETHSLMEYVGTTLEDLQIGANLSGNQITQLEVSRAFEGMPFSPGYLMVTNADGSLLYSYKETERGTGRARMGLKNLKDVQQWNDVRLPDGSLAFRFAFHLPAFDEVQSNKFLIAAYKLLLLVAFLVSALLSFFLAFLFTRPLKRESQNVVQALQSMAGGQRDVPLLVGNVAEFNDIAVASQVLQEHLVVEEQLRRQWAEDVAHDLRTPLSVLRAQLEAMEDGVFKPEKARLSKLVQETGKLETLVNSLSLLSRLETPGFAPKLQDIDVESLLLSVCSQYDPLARQRGVTLQVVSPKATLASDPSLLERALGNLLANAIKYGKEGGVVQLVVTVNDQGEATSLCMENEGTVKSEVLAHMFDRLYRGDGARATEGTGLGLSIVKAIVEAHRWSIAIVSEASTKAIISFTQSLPY